MIFHHNQFIYIIPLFILVSSLFLCMDFCRLLTSTFYPQNGETSCKQSNSCTLLRTLWWVPTFNSGLLFCHKISLSNRHRWEECSDIWSCFCVEDFQLDPFSLENGFLHLLKLCWLMSEFSFLPEMHSDLKFCGGKRFRCQNVEKRKNQGIFCKIACQNTRSNIQQNSYLPG